ncbi:hypothetical protein BT96DRAFT_940532 [Gymnopus androsaceus JB14]|uniref:Uncharacterized protein n=1 Tax=Gymnopus androsaceus JB14 TaxID=1447944 RepID=A0A6A4HLQ5_9AGAR|nr:hypothetical protein BT96DRAFT_940532 [Gymnopus androsaceus JB14]
MSAPNPQTPQPPCRSSMRLKRKVKEGSGSPAPKRMKRADDPEDPGLLPSKEAPLRLTCSKSRMITSSKSPSKAGPSFGSRPLQRRIQAWEAEPIPNTVVEGRFSSATELSEESD